MSLENANLSRRKLLKAGAIGVPAAGVLAFGSTLVTATSANAISADGWWGSETSAGLQRFMNTVMNAGLVVDGVISSQPSGMASVPELSVDGNGMARTSLPVHLQSLG